MTYIFITSDVLWTQGENFVGAFYPQTWANSELESVQMIWQIARADRWRSCLLGGIAGMLACMLPVTAVRAVELIMLEEDGCAWCERWNKEVGGIYHKTPEGQRAPLRRLDIHEKLPSELKFLTKGRYTPTFVLIDKGREIGRIRGYPGEDFFWGLLAKMLKRLPLAATGAANSATTIK